MAHICLEMVLLALAAAPPGSAAVERAERAIEALEYSTAASELDAALSAPANTRETLLRALWLRGMISALMNKPDAARPLLRQLAALDPDFMPDPSQPTRVLQAWLEAKGFMSASGSIQLSSTAGTDALTLRAQRDSLKLGRTVRVHLREDGRPWRVATVRLTGAEASVRVKGSRLEWWAELLGEREAVLLVLGSEADPRVDAFAGPPVAVAEPPPPEPVVTPPPAPAPEPLRPPPPAVAKSDGASPLKIGAIAGAAAAAIAFGVAVGFGVTSSSEARRLADAEKGSDGAVIGLTQVEARALIDQSRFHASLANGLYVTAGALAVTAALLWLLGVR